MKCGSIVEYRDGNGTETGTVIRVTNGVVTVIHPENPELEQAVNRDRILNVLKEAGIE